MILIVFSANFFQAIFEKQDRSYAFNPLTLYYLEIYEYAMILLTNAGRNQEHVIKVPISFHINTRCRF
jgi:hypothetical protein